MLLTTCKRALEDLQAWPQEGPRGHLRTLGVRLPKPMPATVQPLPCPPCQHCTFLPCLAQTCLHDKTYPEADTGCTAPGKPICATDSTTNKCASCINSDRTDADVDLGCNSATPHCKVDTNQSNNYCVVRLQCRAGCDSFALICWQARAGGCWQS